MPLPTPWHQGCSYACTLCPATAATYRAMAEHTRRRHAGAKDAYERLGDHIKVSCLLCKRDIYWESEAIVLHFKRQHKTGSYDMRNIER